MAGEQTIDELNIEINAEASKGSSGLDKLVASIEKLKTVTGGGVGNLTGIAGSLQKLTSMLSGMKSQSGIVSSLANSINKLNDARTDRISGSISALTTSLKSLGGMDSGLKTIVSDLATLAKSGTGSVGENALKLQAQAAKTKATIDQSSLKSAKAQQGLQDIANKNKAIEDSARAAAQQEQQLTDSINASIQRHIEQTGSAAGFSNKAADLGAVTPDYTEEVPYLTRAALTGQGAKYRVEDSINDLKTAMGEAGNAAGAAGSAGAAAMGEISTGSERASGFVSKLRDNLSETGRASNSLFSLGRFYGVYFILKQIANTFGGWINNINSYIENQNLFAVAMGKSAQEGRKLADSLQSVLGIDSGEAMRYMGIFAQLTTSFGIANKQAMLMSENMTQLGYDISSFYNISTEKAFSKLQSGITGQVRAIRELGIDTSNARLQQELYNLGINEKVRNLTEADKAELRYIAIMKQTTNAQGDMARTIQTPANALRVLQAQFVIAGRAIGSVFIPALEMILPVVTAVVEVIGDLASELAAFFGFQMPKIDYSSLDTGLSGVADDADDAAAGIGNVGDAAGDTGKKAKDAAKDLDNLISGFDELNIVQKDTSEDTGAGTGTGGGSSGVGGAGGNLLGGIDLPQYNSLADAIGNKVDDIKDKIKDFIDAFKEDPLKAFADALWGVGGAFGELGKWLTSLDFADILNGITAAVMAYGLTKNPILALAIGAVATAISHFLPQKSKIDLLCGSLIALGSALVLKAFTGMPFGLALGISALLESGLVELIGTRASITLLTSALVGLGTGMLAFSFTGNLPLAVGIGAVSAAISGLAIHFSDMQIAPALLAGVTTGLLAFKLGMDSWSAGAVGLGAALVSFAELNDLAPGLRDGLLGLGGAVTALGLAFQLGFGPQGLVIATVAGALIGLGAGMIQASEDAKKADLEKRFGSIKLSAQECQDVAERLTKTPWTVKIDAAIDAKDKLKDMEKAIASDVETLNKLNWKVSIGMQLTKGEANTYKETVNSFVEDARNYVQQQQYSVTLAINASFEQGSDTQKNLLQFVNSYYGGAQRQLDSLGKQLSDEVNKAFSDNVMTEGEYLKIADIEQKMQAIINKIADAEYKAKLNNLTADVSEKGLTADSFTDLQKQIQKAVDDRLAKADTVRLKAKAAAELKLDEDGNKAAYDKAIAEIQETYNQQKSKIDLAGLDVSLDTLNSKFSSELKAAVPNWTEITKGAFKNGFQSALDKPEDIYSQPVKQLTTSLQGAYVQSMDSLNIAPEARKNIVELVKQLQPTEDDLKLIAASCKKAGKKVPENVSKGISDIEQMKAIGDDTAAINYMIGRHLSTEPDFLDMLATVKGAGKDVDKNIAEGITDNIELMKDPSTGAVYKIRDTVTGKTTEITPTLEQNLSALGVNMTNSFTTSVKNQQPGINTTMSNTGSDAGKNMASGLNGKVPDVNAGGANLGKGALKGAQDQLNKDKQSWLDWAIWPWNWFKQQNQINSPSKLFYSGGENIVQGLWNGVQDKFKGFMTWWTGQDIPVPHFKFGWESLDNYDNFAANAAKKLGLKQIPTVHIKWYANGAAFYGKDVIGVGEYSGAQSNPEVVAPQSIIRATVEESNGNVVAVLSRILDVAEKIAEKDTTVNLDGEKISDNTNKHNASRGYNLGLQST